MSADGKKEKRKRARKNTITHDELAAIEGYLKSLWQTPPPGPPLGIATRTSWINNF